MSLVIPHIPDLKLSPKDSKNPYVIKNLIEACKEVIYSDFDINTAVIFVNKKVRLSKPLTPAQFDKIKEYVTSGNYHKYKAMENVDSGMIESHMINIDTLKRCIQIARRTLLLKSIANDMKAHNISIYDVHATSKILEVTDKLVNSMNTIQQYTPSLLKLQMEVDAQKQIVIHNGNGNGNGKSNIDRNTNKSLGNGNGHSGNGHSGQNNIGQNNIQYDTKQEEPIHDSIESISNAGTNKPTIEGHSQEGSDTSRIPSGAGEDVYLRNRFGEETGIIDSTQKQNTQSTDNPTETRSSEQDKNLNGGIGKPTNRVF